MRLHLRNKQFIVLFVLAFATGLVNAVEQPELGHQLNLVERTLAPDFELPDIDGEPHKLSDYHGKVIMLNFWGTWCPPCRREMPSMQRLYQKFKEKGLVVIAVNQFETEDIVFEFTARLSLVPTFPILLDRESRITEIYKVPGLPTTFLIDKQGMIRYRAIGGREFDHPEVEKIISALIKE